MGMQGWLQVPAMAARHKANGGQHSCGSHDLPSPGPVAERNSALLKFPHERVSRAQGKTARSWAMNIHEVKNSKYLSGVH